ncbi:hypothetical protein F4W05_13305 [Ewingella americana]|uniref:Protein of uncharacterized function (DUF2765) n=1 Tax=Ewingella americana TaxID=41202 RepID=A0A377N5R5_9GAMM|nr:putative phage tail assembly chaperone [Ewingella americana]KAA8727589.1 hypothetical protein F4W05_13305 [Ewingella americana]STQ42871.1 Protein of uncharacterised function (DUF2765) [Ewingella americana]
MSKVNTIELTVNGKALNFEPNSTAYNKFINEMSMENKIAPANNYLRRIVATDSKAALDEILDIPGSALQLAAAVNDKYAPKLEIELKN